MRKSCVLGPLKKLGTFGIHNTFIIKGMETFVKRKRGKNPKFRTIDEKCKKTGSGDFPPEPVFCADFHYSSLSEEAELVPILLLSVTRLLTETLRMALSLTVTPVKASACSVT